MTLATYSFYVEDFQGSKIPSESFTKYINKADYNLKKMTQNRVIEDQYETQYNLSACEIADYFYECDLNYGKDISSESVGSYSVNYAIQPYRDFDIAMSYLANTGLLSVGVYVN